MTNKIVLVAELSQPWHNGWYHKSGLEKIGHTVIPFDPAKVDRPVEKIRQLVSEHRPDFILHAKDELPAEGFQELRKIAKVVMWYPDLSVSDQVLAYVKAADIFITMSEGLVDTYRAYNPHVYWLTQAFEPSFFQVQAVSDRDRKKYSSDVVFVGTLASKSYYLPRRQLLKRIIKEGIALKWWGPRLPRKIATIPLILGKLGRSYGGSFIWGEEFVKVAQLSKVFLAFDSAPYIRKSMSARMYTAVGCGAFYLCRHVDGIEEVLEPGKEIVTFKTEDEMVEMVRYYLKQDELRGKIARAGQERVLKEHTYEVRMGQLLEIVRSALY